MAKEKKSAADLQMAAFEERRKAIEKEKGIEVYALIVPLDDDGSRLTAGYIRKADRATVSNCLTLQSQGRVLDASEALIRSTWIEGDEQILENDDLFYAAHIAVQGMVKFRQGILKKN